MSDNGDGTVRRVHDRKDYFLKNLKDQKLLRKYRHLKSRQILVKCLYWVLGVLLGNFIDNQTSVRLTPTY